MTSFVQRLGEDPVAVATLLLALVTVAAIVVPLVVTAREKREQRDAARDQVVILLDAFVELLNEQVREPAWGLGRGVDVLAGKLLDDRLLSALTSKQASLTAGAVAMAHRVLTSDDRVLQARTSQNAGQFDAIKNSATVARDRINAARDLIAPKGASG